ncbi:unnamed protein product [Allacma fusca]|uniref:Peptidase S1 domain-containing protein n=1 Tax=Allacma fusca TaxID=39272 RepID=A0A8J2JZN6_9HEXA|nr:unnamed protein product [Allacma fusca]
MNKFIYLALSHLLLVGLIYISSAQDTSSSADDPCNCGDSISSRIVGGDEVQPGELPWRVSIFIHHKNESRGSICGGTIIDKFWVMTAAHCVDRIASKGSTPSDINIFIGDGSIYRYDSQNGTLRLLSGNNVVIHPKWNRTIVDFDIALIRVPGGFNFSRPNTARACLPFKFRETTLKNQQVLASGWGQTSNATNSTSRVMRRTDLDMMEYEDCNENLQEMNIGNRIDQKKFCCKTPGKDICQGDSGGSIDYLFEGKYYAFGIVSYVLGFCANPRGVSVMTRVVEYLDWILGITGGNYCSPP